MNSERSLLIQSLREHGYARLSAAQATASPELPLYRTACDPRLNARQALQVTAAFADSFRLAAASRGAA